MAGPAQAAATCNDNLVIVSAANQKAVSVELGADLAGTFNHGVLRARATTIGPWERFTLCMYPSYFTLKSNANGLYVKAEINSTVWNGVLRAKSSKVSGWEKFTKSNIGNGWDYFLISQANSKYVATEVSWTGSQQGMLRARSSGKGSWETYLPGWG